MTSRGSIAFNPRFKAKILRSIRTKTLGKLVVLYWHFLSDWNCQASRNVIQRERKKNPCLRLDRSNVAYALKPQDVMPVLHCSRRTAIDYIQALRWLCGS
jgi:hypothetical protein